MPKPDLNRRLRPPAWVAGLACATLGHAAAQTTDPISACKSSSPTDAARIECLENALRRFLPTAPQANAAPAPSAAPVDAKSAAPAAPAAVAPAAPVAAAESVPVNAAPVSGLGAEQVARKIEKESPDARKQRRDRERDETISTKIVDFARTKTGRLILVLDNGQVWAQRGNDSTDVRLRDGDSPDVVVRRGAFSGYRMEISKPNVTIVVERLR